MFWGRQKSKAQSFYGSIVYFDNFTTTFPSKLFSDLYIGVHLKGSKKFGSKMTPTERSLLIISLPRSLIVKLSIVIGNVFIERMGFRNYQFLVFSITILIRV